MQNKKPSVGRVWIFSGTAHHFVQVFCLFSSQVTQDFVNLAFPPHYADVSYRFHFLRNKFSVQGLVTLQKLNYQCAILFIFDLK